MNRRKFLKNSLAGLPVIAFAPSILAKSCINVDKENVAPNGKSVVVVGAGISGLAAAKMLNENGFEVTILEAQEKIGGRLRTNRSMGIAFDEGASYIHGINGNPITALAQQAGMNTTLSNEEDFVSYDLGGVLRSDSLFSNTEDEFYKVINTLKNSGSANQSFKEVFENLYPERANDRLWKFFLSTYLTFDTGDLDQLSSFLYDEGEVFGGNETIAINGYDNIPNYLASGLNIRLNQRVSRIEYAEEKVIVTHNNNTSTADFVVVSVPLGVLKANKIQFVPELPENKKVAIEGVGMGCVNKFLLRWDTVFWDDEQYISYTPEESDKFNFFLNLNKSIPQSKALMTFAYADYARLTETMTDEVVIQEIMKHLKDIYGDSIPNPTQFLRTKWQSNENAFGAYSFTAVGTKMQHFEDLAKEIANRVFFAGEHTEIDYFSTSHGAYLSGIREAEKIIDLV